jgi:hypothetical protein
MHQRFDVTDNVKKFCRGSVFGEFFGVLAKWATAFVGSLLHFINQGSVFSTL